MLPRCRHLKLVESAPIRQPRSRLPKGLSGPLKDGLRQADRHAGIRTGWSAYVRSLPSFGGDGWTGLALGPQTIMALVEIDLTVP